MHFGKLVIAIGMAATIWIAVGKTVYGQVSGRGGGRHGGGVGGDSRSTDPASSYHPRSQVVLTPHGGSYLSNNLNVFEVVYLPFQARIYLYDQNLKPLSAHDLHVRMSLQLPTQDTPQRTVMAYIPPLPGKPEQDYVAADFDFQRLPDGDLPITFEFADLPDRKNPTASFTPVFSASKIRSYVAQVLPVEADREGMIRQRVCPVSGDVLGSKGPIVKVLIGQTPLYLSNESCIEAVQGSPERFLRPSASPAAGLSLGR